jgi:hypothetical protein
MTGSTATRAGTKRTGGRRRAVGTRDRIVAHLADVAEIADRTGMASTRLAEAVGYPGSSVAFAQLLSGMERDGLIAREVRGKRTYRITLAASARAARAAAARRSAAVPGAPGAQPAAGAHANGASNGAGQAAPLGADSGAPGAPAASPAGFDYDELARRLLIQVVRRLAATPSGLEQTVAGLERELATAWTSQGALTAENVRLREQLREAQRDLELARERSRKLTISDELDQAEMVMLERLLTADPGSEGRQSGATA